jgi:hypothetical protein
MDWPRDRTRASAVGGRRLTAWAVARPHLVFSVSIAGAVLPVRNSMVQCILAESPGFKSWFVGEVWERSFIVNPGKVSELGRGHFLSQHFNFFFPMAQQPLVGQGLLTVEASRSHSDTPHSLGLCWTSDQPEAETSTWQHTTHTRGCPRRNSNPQSSQANGRSPTP